MLDVMTEPRRSSRKRPISPAPVEAAEVADSESVAEADEVTTYKIYRRDAKLLNKIGAMLDTAQQDTIAHFRREYENLWEFLIATEAKRLNPE